MKQKKQIAVLVVLLLILVVVGYFYFDSDKPVVTADAGFAQNYKLLPVDNLSLHKDGVTKARKTDYKSSGRNIFSRELPPPPAPPPPRVPKPGDKDYHPPIITPPPSPTVAGPLPVKFFGYGTVPNGTARLAFFDGGEDVFIVKEGELLMNRFRILKIGNTSLEYEEISSGLRGTATLEDQAGPPSA
jgi:hypothetical protein